MPDAINGGWLQSLKPKLSGRVQSTNLANVGDHGTVGLSRQLPINTRGLFLGANAACVGFLSSWKLALNDKLTISVS